MIKKPNIKTPKLVFTSTPPFRKSTDYVIIHHAAGHGSIEQEHEYHVNHNCWNGIGYHYYIRTDGTIYQGRQIYEQGIHCVGKNSNSVAICFEGNFQTESLSTGQLNSGEWLAAWLLEYFNLPISALREHRDFNATACPGANFPSMEFKKGVEKIMLESKKLDQKANEDGELIPKGCETACKWAVENKIVFGYGNGKYGWNEPVTLARAVTIMKRMIEKMS